MVFISPGFYLFGEKATWAAVILQFLALVGTAFMAARAAYHFRPSTHRWVFILVLLNPVALIHSHILITETFYAFLVSTVLWSLIEGAYTKKPSLFLISGLFFGAMALVRPEAKFFLYLTPLVLPLSYIIVNGIRSLSFKLCFITILACAAGYGATLPWQNFLAQQNKNSGGSTGQKQYDHISWSAAILENLKSGGSSVHGAYYSHTLPRGEEYLKSLPHKQFLKESEKKSALNWFYVKEILSYPPSLIGYALLKSWTIIYAAAGNQYLMKLLNLQNSIPQDVQHSPNIIERLKNHFMVFPLTVAFSIPNWIVTIGFRLLGLLGLFALFRQKNYKCLALTIPPVVLITLIFLFDGHSRVRLPLEPIRLFWSVFGFQYFKDLLWKK